ncbi:MAG: GTP 3',8-cyclase MoaA [Alcanivoracaceae bacterium]
MLQDRYGRRFRYLRLSVTDVCNFRCTYCLPSGYQAPAGVADPFLSAAEVAVIAAAFARLGTSKVRLTGGEPSLRADLPELIRRCKDTAGIRTVALTSNGYRLPRQIDDWHRAGLDALNISIDSLDRDEFTRITGHDRLPHILAGIDRAVALGLSSIKVNAVLLREGQAARMHDFLDWLRETPVTLRFIELMQTGDNAVFFRHQHLRAEEMLLQLKALGWQESVRSHDAGPARELWHADYAGRIGFIMPYSKDFCASCNRLRVSAQGRLHLCLFANEGQDIRDWCQRGDVEGLMAHLQHLVGDKRESHLLQQQQTGATRHFAMIGG